MPFLLLYAAKAQLTTNRSIIMFLQLQAQGRSQPKSWGGGVELKKFDFTIVLNYHIMKNIAEFSSYMKFDLVLAEIAEKSIFFIENRPKF